MSTKKETLLKKYNFPKEVCDKIEELAEEAGVTNTEAVINAILFRYNADVMDEHIVLGRITQMQKKLDYMDKKLETFSSLIYYIIPYFFPTAQARNAGRLSSFRSADRRRSARGGPSPQ